VIPWSIEDRMAKDYGFRTIGAWDWAIAGFRLWT